MYQVYFVMGNDKDKKASGSTTRSQSQSSYDSELIEKITSAVSASVQEKIEQQIAVKLDTVIDELQKVTGSIRECEKKIESLEQKNDALEQYTRRNSVRIHGIQEVVRENTDNLVLSFLKDKMQLDFTVDDIERSHRVGASNKNINRPILVKFLSYRKRHEVFSKKKILKNSGIVITEDLTKLRYGLYKMAREKYGRNTWTSDGKIFWVDENGLRKIATCVSELI